VINPAVLVGRDVSADPAAVIPALTLAVLAMAAAFLWIQWHDVPLEAAQ
jgi:hypothetical protein